MMNVVILRLLCSNSEYRNRPRANIELEFIALAMLSYPRILIALAAIVSTASADDIVVPGDNLVLQGVPAIPSKLMDEIGRYTEMRQASFASWHPVRREMLILTRFADAVQVHHVKAPGGARTQLSFFKDGVHDASFQPTHGDYFVFSKDTGGDENFQKYRFDMETGAVTLITDGKSRNTGGVWSTAGRHLAYGSTRRNKQDVDLWIVDPADPKSDRMIAEMKGGGWSPLDFSPDDRLLLVSEYVSANESHLWLVDVAAGTKTPLLPAQSGEKSLYSSARFSLDGKSIYAITDRDSEFRRLAAIDLATKQHAFLTSNIPWDIDSFTQSWDGKRIAYVVNEEGAGVLHERGLSSGSDRILSAPNEIVFGISWHRQSGELGFNITAANAVADCWSIARNGKSPERWTLSETGGIQVADFQRPSIIRWKSFDGASIAGFLSTPPARFTGKRPVIIDIHGGPEGQSRPGFQSMNSYFVNELGIAVIRPNIRGSTGYGKTFVTLDNGFKREDSYKDIAALLDWIKEQPSLDADRVLVMGGSYGGHMTLAVATHYPDRIRCAIDVVGIANLVTFLENTSAYRRDLRRVEYGDERDPKMREYLNRIAPANLADRITKPLFIVQGGNDPRVPQSESEQMVQRLRANQTPVWYLLAKDEGHGFAKKKNRDFLFACTVLFVREFLLK